MASCVKQASVLYVTDLFEYFMINVDIKGNKFPELTFLFKFLDFVSPSSISFR